MWAPEVEQQKSLYYYYSLIIDTLLCLRGRVTRQRMAHLASGQMMVEWLILPAETETAHVRFYLYMIYGATVPPILVFFVENDSCNSKHCYRNSFILEVNVVVYKQMVVGPET